MRYLNRDDVPAGDCSIQTGLRLDSDITSKTALSLHAVVDLSFLAITPFPPLFEGKCKVSAVRWFGRLNCHKGRVGAHLAAFLAIN